MRLKKHAHGQSGETRNMGNIEGPLKRAMRAEFRIGKFALPDVFVELFVATIRIERLLSRRPDGQHEHQQHTGL